MSEFLTCFEVVWQTLGEKYFDPAFGGLDWNDVHDRYQSQIAAVENERTFYELVNKMLFELDVSHTAVVPPDQMDQLAPTQYAEGSIGIDLRLLGEVAAITVVEPGSPGEQAGLRPGLIVEQINGQTVRQLSSEVRRTPPLNERSERGQATNNIRQQVYGAPGTRVSLTYLDEGGEAHESAIQCTPRKGKVAQGGGAAPCFLEFNSRRVDGDIGYIRFDAFIPPVHERFTETLASFGDTRGVIVDIRGNHGGVWPIRKLLADNFVREPVLFCSYRSRKHTNEVYLEPVENAYTASKVSICSLRQQSGILKASQ